jgi:LmbE family N-acetylglucosaminyl deacetylase
MTPLRAARLFAPRGWVTLTLALALAGCGSSAPRATTAAVAARRAPSTLWVVAPHPDDEVLMASQALLEAVARGAPYQIAIVTNGDFTCTRDGWARQRESIAALASLGVTEDHVHFLGYPDGWLALLGPEPLAPLARTAPDGSCGIGEATYGARGAEHADVHTARTGAAGPLTSRGLVDDLIALFEAAPPSEIHLPHPIDAHPDHAMTYAYVRRALDRASLERLPVLRRHVVHAGPCWPSSDANGACIPSVPELDATPLPPLPPPLARYAPDYTLVADAARRRTAIGYYVSQLEAPLEVSWLGSFSRTNEASWTESLARTTAGSAVLPVGARSRAAFELAVGQAHTSGLEPRREVIVARAADLSLVVREDGREVARRAMETPTSSDLHLTVHAVSETGATLYELHGPEGLIMSVVVARSSTNESSTNESGLTESSSIRPSP